MLDPFDDLSMLGNEFDADALHALAQERHASAKNEMARPGRFIGTSLGAWLKHAADAGIPHVPAEKIFSIARDEWLHAEDRFPGNAGLMSQLELACKSQPATHMVRIDPCSGLGLKQAMSEGQERPSIYDCQMVDPSDPRAFDIVYEYPGDEIDVWSRPWAKAMRLGGFPVEFRVFVEDSKVIGVASYYPQRPLPDTPEVNGYACACKGLAEQLIAHLNASGQTPWMPNYRARFGEGQVHATIDFIIDEQGKPVFLEAGPPYGAGAHPCAFIDRPIAGIALGLADCVQLR